MKFFKPQVQLVREQVMDQPDAYHLHVVTFCPHTNYRADGHSVNAADLSQGLYRVQINLLQDATLPDFPYITPVVHTISLGSIAFPGGDGWIEVQVQGAVIEAGSNGNTRATTPKTTTKTGGTGTVSTTDADSNPRPIMVDML